MFFEDDEFERDEDEGTDYGDGDEPIEVCSVCHSEFIDVWDGSDIWDGSGLCPDCQECYDDGDEDLGDEV